MDFYNLDLKTSSDELNDALSDLEERNITTSDLISLDVAEIAKRANIQLAIVEKLRETAIHQLHQSVTVRPSTTIDGPDLRISILDAELDKLLKGGFPLGHVTEVVGPSGSGKTQMVLTLLLSSQLPAPHGISRPSLYIGTEHPLPTSRLAQMLAQNLTLKSANPKPTLGRILTLNASDLETQEHILNYQLPIVLERHDVGIVVIDSIAANYRGEGGATHGEPKKQLSDRSADLIKLGTLLRRLSQKHNCAIVCCNQVADKLEPLSGVMNDSSQGFMSSPDAGPGPDSTPSNIISESVLSLDHQQKFFTGWGDARPGFDGTRRRPQQNDKVPALGLIWSNQISGRLALYKSTESGSKRPHLEQASTIGPGQGEVPSTSGADWSSRVSRRWARLAYASWAEQTDEDDPGVEFEIWAGGIRSLTGPEMQD